MKKQKPIYFVEVKILIDKVESDETGDTYINKDVISVPLRDMRTLKLARTLAKAIKTNLQDRYGEI